MPEKLFLLAEEEGIGCAFFDLPYPLLGLYDYRCNEIPMILLDNSLKKDRKLLRCVLAEEIGHHFTTSQNIMVFSRKDNYMYMKYEKLALWWATKYLMPLKELIKAINGGLFLTHEIAEHFEVTERFAGIGLKLYIEKENRALLKGLKKLPMELRSEMP